MQIVCTAAIAAEYPEDIIFSFMDKFLELMTKYDDPDNPNLWALRHDDGRIIWGILDEFEDEDQPNIFTILFPEDY